VRPDFWRSMPVVSRLAGPGNPGRRSFLGMGAALTGGLALGARPGYTEPPIASPPADAPWSQSIGPGVVDRPYGRPAESEAGVIRRNVPWLTAGTESSICFSPLQDLHGIITPNGLFFERHHAGRPDVDPDQHRLMIHGLVERPLILTMKDIARFPSVSRIHFIECPANGGMEWRAAVEGADTFHAALALGRPVGAAGIPRGRRDWLCAADHYAVAKATRVEFGLPQQFDPDLAGKAGRECVRCSALVSVQSTQSPPALSLRAQRSNPEAARKDRIASSLRSSQ
jgi:hypothetical protein